MKNIMTLDAMDLKHTEQLKAARDLECLRHGVLTPMAAISKGYSRMDNAIALVPGKVACKEGCSYCCHYHVYVYGPEVFALAEFINTKLDVNTRAKVKKQLEENAKKIAGMTVKEHIKTNVVCALLDDGGHCLAYSMRPFACRNHHAVDVTPCRITFDDPSIGMDLVSLNERTLTARNYMAAFVAEMRQQNLDSNRYEMNSSLLEALSNKSCMKRWRDGKVSFLSTKDRAY